MVGVQDQADIEYLGGPLARPAARDLEQEVAGQAEPRIRLRQLPPVAGRFVGGDKHGLLCGQPRGFTQVGVRAVGVLVRVAGARQRHQRPQRLHRLLVMRDPREIVSHESAEPTPGNELGVIAGELVGSRRGAALQQIGDLFEGRRPGQLVDVIAAVRQPADPAVDIAQRGRRGHDIRQSL